MPTDVRVTPLDPHEFGVETLEGTLVTGHKVRIDPEWLEEMFPLGVDEERLVRESFEFLLDREKATSILSDFTLDKIGDYYPEYIDEIRARLAA